MDLTKIVGKSHRNTLYRYSYHILSFFAVLTFLNFARLSDDIHSVSSLIFTSKTAPFLGFVEERELRSFQWVYDSNTKKIRVTLPAYAEEQTLTPQFDTAFAWSFRDLTNMLPTGYRITTATNSRKPQEQIILQVREFSNRLILKQEFAIHFGAESGLGQTILEVNIEKISDFNMEDWIGIGDEKFYLGDGGFGVIYKVHHRFYNASCAVKIREATHRYDTERDVSIKLRGNEHAIQIYGYATRSGIDSTSGGHKKVKEEGLLLYELLDNDVWHLIKTIRRYIRKNAVSRDDPQYTELKLEMLEIARNATRALLDTLLFMRTFNHAHFDIKSTNILYQQIESHVYRFKVNDFGTALPRKNDTSDKYLMIYHRRGTWGFSDPQTVFDARVDQFSIGATLFELITWRYAWEGPMSMNKRKLTKKTYRQRMFEGGDLDRCKYCWKGVEMDPVAKDFIIRMMKYRPEQRMTLKEARAHPYINSPVSIR